MHDAGELILFRDTENGFLSRLAQLRAACGADTFIQTKTSDTKQETRQLRLQCVSDYTALIRERTPLDSIDFDAICRSPSLFPLGKDYRAHTLGGKG